MRFQGEEMFLSTTRCAYRDIVNVKMICRLSLSKVLIGVGCPYVRSYGWAYARMYERFRLYCIQKQTWQTLSFVSCAHGLDNFANLNYFFWSLVKYNGIGMQSHLLYSIYGMIYVRSMHVNTRQFHFWKVIVQYVYAVCKRTLVLFIFGE